MDELACAEQDFHASKIAQATHPGGFPYGDEPDTSVRGSFGRSDISRDPCRLAIDDERPGNTFDTEALCEIEGHLHGRAFAPGQPLTGHEASGARLTLTLEQEETCA